jgi:FSR family fosmidomycin resistance protein-like MFS transporter
VNKPVVVTEETLVAPVIGPEGAAAPALTGPTYLVLGGISLSHFLNDTMQSLIPSVYPILKENYALDFAQIGLITLAFQITASLLQPVVGHFTDRKRCRSRWRSAWVLRSAACCCSASPMSMP